MRTLKIPPSWKCDWQITTLIAVAAGIGAAVGCALLPWWVLLLLLPLTVTLDRGQLTAAGVAFTVCLLSGIIQSAVADKEKARLSGHDAVVSGTAVCFDRRASALEALPRPATLNCEIRCGGETFPAAVIFPGKERIFYGDRFTFTGKLRFARPAGLLCRDGKITGEYPPLYGDRPLLMIDRYSRDGHAFSLMRPFFLCREFILGKLLSHVGDGEIAAMAARLFFGASGGAPPALRDRFVASGTIHLFSVSGLHVTLLSGIILMLLRPLPFRLRYRIAAAVTLFYVLASGASLPAVRAGTMVIVWCLMRSSLYYAPSWNAIMTTWTAFAVIAPESVGSLSAQYSFGITAALLLASRRMQDLAAVHRKIADLMPRRAAATVRWKKRAAFGRKALAVPVVAVTAFAAGCGISLCRQNLFTPGSIPANLLLVFITPLIFGAMILKLSAALFIPPLDGFAAEVMEAVFRLLTAFTGAAAKFFAPLGVPRPPQWSIMLYYLLFFGALGARSKRSRCACAVAALLVFASWQMPFFQPGRKFIAVSHGSGVPALLALTFPDGGAAVIDVPTADAGALAGIVLRECGVRRAEVFCSSGSIASVRGIEMMKRHIRVTVHKPENDGKTGRAFLKRVSRQGVHYLDLPGGHRLSASGHGDMTCRDFYGFSLSATSSDDGRLIEITAPDGSCRKEKLPWASLPVIRQWEFR